MSLIEGQFVESERKAVQYRVDEAPIDADAFLPWFESLGARSAGPDDALFDWLAGTATLTELHWFLEQEAAAEAGFEDLIALTQLHMPPGPKLALGRHYQGEPGRGSAPCTQAMVLTRSVLPLPIELPTRDIVWESLALANLMHGLASNRFYAYQSIGALGAAELIAPARRAMIDTGLHRLGVHSQSDGDSAPNASVDLRRSRALNAEVIRPLIGLGPAIQRAIAEGALLRLCAAARCVERYRQVLVPKPALPLGGERRLSSRASGMPISFR